ncbi:MAG: type II toxin-antitoxin system RelE/ParE family toxin [Fibrobacteres bacterium]|jgi:putative addiction module killer protein|nr:type II toxin-antitoxin system RelE/ParE family toxin [Fibrobacterota bacterium]
MYITKLTNEFEAWVNNLKDIRAFAHITRRLNRIESGNLGDVKPVGNKIFEIRIDYGPGYRLYYTKRNNELILLLIGGDKSTQKKDIEKATLLAHEYGDTK